MKDFFFDTANLDFIKSTFDKYCNDLKPNLIRGVTTNPNAFQKIGLTKLDEWLSHAIKVANLIGEIRGDKQGQVHIQIPNSELHPDTILEYAKLINDTIGDLCQVGMKIPPYQNVLEHLEMYNNFVLTNVTGLADPGTALKCCTYDVNYISIIPGRMEEVGINAENAISFVNQCKFGKTEIITGSQRTTDQVISCFAHNTIPTIGEKCWNDIFEGDNFKRIKDMQQKATPFGHFSPLITNENINLSLSFFEQMDEMGKIAFEDLIKKLKK